LQPDISHHFAAGLYAKQHFIPKGYAVAKHVHNYSHLSILAKGIACVDVDGEQTIYEAPACIEIKANCSHVIISETDCIWYCIHATEEAEADLYNTEIIEGEPHEWMGRLGGDAAIA
jgi:quercetin dioxygenase-like cupin family protein